MRKVIRTLIERIEFIRDALDGKEPDEEIKKAVVAFAREAWKKSRSREEDDEICDATVWILTSEEMNQISKGA